MTINVVLLLVAASNYASSIATASIAILAADIVPSSLLSDAPSQAALLHVQMLVGADSSHYRNWTVYCNSGGGQHRRR
jgi:invasion protein IalB